MSLHATPAAAPAPAPAPAPPTMRRGGQEAEEEEAERRWSRRRRLSRSQEANETSGIVSNNNDDDDHEGGEVISPPDMDVAAPHGLQPHSRRVGGREWREYASGGSATVLAIVATFPINKAMYRQQVHNISPGEAARQLLHEGAFNIYRGLPSPLLMKTLSHSIMFGSYAQFSRLLQENCSPPMSRSQCRKVGAGLAGFSEATLMPLERVQVLMQDAKYTKRFRNTGHALWELRSYGLLEYYRGVSAILLRNCVGNVIFFTQRERLKASLPERWQSSPSYETHLADFFGGACLGAVISTVFYPVNVAKVHMQRQIGGSFKRLSSVFLWLLRERGWRGMFRGVHTNYTRSFLSWGIVNLAYENILRYLQNW